MRAFLHVGLQKTGTSYLQSHLWDSPEQLAEQGVRMVPADRVQAFRLSRAVVAEDPAEVPPAAAGSIEALFEDVAAATEPVLLLSQEALASAGADRAALLRDVFTGRELHLVVTVRDLARQLPSAWQQRVKSRGSIALPAFVDLVRSRGEGSEVFWRHHDLVAVLERWATGLPPDRVHVVTAPPPGSAPELLAERFGEVVGVDFTRLHADDLRTNVSLDPVQAEMLRRLNLRGRIFQRRGAHARMVKQVLAGQVLAPRRGGSLLTPPEAAGWCRIEAESQIAHVRERGYSVHGDLDDLRPREVSFGLSQDVSDTQVLDLALDTVAELLRRLDHAQRVNKRLRS